MWDMARSILDVAKTTVGTQVYDWWTHHISIQSLVSLDPFLQVLLTFGTLFALQTLYRHGERIVWELLSPLFRLGRAVCSLISRRWEAEANRWLEWVETRRHESAGYRRMD